MDIIYKLDISRLRENIVKNTDSRIERVIDFATEKHSGQICKFSGDPYIIHPLRVANILIENLPTLNPTTKYNIISAAILHNVLRDTDCTVDEIEKEFRRDITDIVSELTVPKNLGTEDVKFWQLGKFPYMSEEAQIVKLADNIDNLIDTPDDYPMIVSKFLFWSNALYKVSEQHPLENTKYLSQVLSGAILKKENTLKTKWE